MNSLISFDIKFKYIYILFYLLTTFPFVFSISQFKEFDNIYVQIYNNFIYGIMNLILYFISKYRSQILKKERKLKVLQKKKIFISIFIVFLLCIIDNKFYSFILQYYIDYFLDYSFFSLLSIIPFSIFFFKLKIYNHHILSIIMLFICTILIIYNEIKQSIGILGIFVQILYFINFGLEMSLFKYFMEKYFLSPYLICVIQSITSIFLILIETLYDFFISNENPFFKSYIELQWNDKLFMKIFIVALFYSLNFTSSKLAIFYLSPSHVMVGISLGNNIQSIITKKNINELTIIRFCLEIISILIFNEIIILNFCNFNTYTMKGKIERETIEKIDTIINNTNCSQNIEYINEMNDSVLSNNDDDKNTDEINSSF